MKFNNFIFLALKRGFDKGYFGTDALRKAVENKVLSKEQFKSITGQDY